MKRYRSLSSLMVIMVALFSLTACAQKPVVAPTTAPTQVMETVAPTAKEPQKFVLATATKGGVFHPMGTEMAAIWTENAKGMQVTPVNTGGTKENIQKLGLKEVDLGLAVSGVVFYAVSGTGEYKAQGKQTGLRGVLALHPNVVHLLVRDAAGVKSLKDLTGKAWAPGARGSATEVNTREMLEVFQIDSATDLKSFYVGYAETVENMKAGKVDGATLAAGLGGKAIKDTLALGGWKILSLTQDEVDAIVNAYPSYFALTIPAGTYEGQNEPILTVAQSSILVAREDVPEEAVYEMTKAFYTHLSRLQEKVPAASSISLENALKGIKGVVPVHPGAEKYFREVGVIK